MSSPSTLNLRSSNAALVMYLACGVDHGYRHYVPCCASVYEHYVFRIHSCIIGSQGSILQNKTSNSPCCQYLPSSYRSDFVCDPEWFFVSFLGEVCLVQFTLPLMFVGYRSRIFVLAFHAVSRASHLKTFEASRKTIYHIFITGSTCNVIWKFSDKFLSLLFMTAFLVFENLVSLRIDHKQTTVNSYFLSVDVVWRRRGKINSQSSHFVFSITTCQSPTSSLGMRVAIPSRTTSGDGLQAHHRCLRIFFEFLRSASVELRREDPGRNRVHANGRAFECEICS